MKVFIRTLAALVLIAGPVTMLHAGQILVPQDFVVLQDAIDSASPGDVIIIDGGTHPAVVIDKPLYLVGHASNRPLLRALTPPETGGATVQSAPVHLSGPGLGAVTLSGLDLGGTTDGGWFHTNAPAISGGGFDELRVLHCSIQAPAWEGATGVGYGEPCIDVDVTYLLVEDSTVTGGSAITDFYWTDFDVPDGAPGIVATGDVAVFDSTVRGGPGLDVAYDVDIFHPLGCHEVTGGYGGAGVVTPGMLYRGTSTIECGEGAEIVVEFSPGPPPVDWVLCTQEDGPDLVVGNVTAFDAELFLGSGPLVENGSWALAWIASVPDSLLILGLEPTAPVQAGLAGLLFMKPATMILVPIPPPGPTVIDFPIGPLTGEAGFPIAFQRYTLAEGLSRPVFATYTPQ